MRLFPRDQQFFPMFGELGQRLAATATVLERLFAEPDRLNEHAAEIKRLEHEADEITHGIIVAIDRSFVTPLDREDIHLLASRLDDVIDLMDGVARRAQMFHIREYRPQAAQLAAVLRQAAECVAESVGSLQKPKQVLQYTGRLKKLEEEGDAVYSTAVGELFSGSPDPIEVIKWKEMFDRLEDAVDRCDDAWNVVESIAIKNS